MILRVCLELFRYKITRFQTKTWQSASNNILDRNYFSLGRLR